MTQTARKWVYLFREGNASMRTLLGGKGAGIAEMTRTGLPVPPGFTITTEACNAYLANDNQFPAGLWEQVLDALKDLEQRTDKKFGDPKNPLLVSVRSGAMFSMPGMMDTILNLGLNPATRDGVATLTNNPRFANDAYRRFVQLFGKIVMGIPGEKFEHALDTMKAGRADTDLSADELADLTTQFKQIVRESTGQDFPTDPLEQLRMAIGAVFSSWNGRRARDYRHVNHISDDLGTGVNVQAMVFGNMGNDSATGVAFTRNPMTGDDQLFGEYLVNAQGEDVVAGIRTPQPISDMAKHMPEVYNQFQDFAHKLEQHYHEMQDLEFTIERGRLWMLQTRTGKRSAVSALKIAIDMVEAGMIDKATALKRIDPQQLDQLLHPVIDPSVRAEHEPIAHGLAASPGAATGRIVLNADDAEVQGKNGEAVILVRTETAPEDFHGMVAAKAMLTSRGGMTCVAGETKVLTNHGLLTAEMVFDRLEAGETFRILSFDSRTLQPVWREIIAAGRKPAEVIPIAVSQTGRSEQNILRMTSDHKMFVIHNRQLVKKPLEQVLADEDFVTIVGNVPAVNEVAVSPELAYVAGAILSDGHVRVLPTKGSVTFIQKPTPEKADFIRAVEYAFEKAFGVPFSNIRERETVGVLRGREIRGSVEDRKSFRREPAVRLAEIRDNLSTWVLGLGRVALLNFVAGYLDGDGSYAEESSAVRLQTVVAKDHLEHLAGLVIACLRLGIVPQVTNNRDAYLVQIAEHVPDILAYTHRIKAEIPPRLYESQCFPMRSLFSDIVDDVNYMGRVREGIKRNIMFGVEKIRRDLLPLCPASAYREVQALLDSPLRSYRVHKIADAESTMVYNFEVDASHELDKNFVVFSSRMTPVLVSNSHAAVVARGMGKPCVAGCGDLEIDYEAKTVKVHHKVAPTITLKEGDWISIDGSTGEVFAGQLPTVIPEITDDFSTLMQWADEVRTVNVRTNADTPHDAKVARGFGAEGIGLCRTEHMFFEGNRIDHMRAMIVANTLEERRAALAKLEPLQHDDFVGIFEAMDGYPVTIRTLDPPLHEFLPHEGPEINALAKTLGTEVQDLHAKIESLREANPMLGFRGCRLGIIYPEITETQIRAIISAACECQSRGIVVKPEIMIPLVSGIEELHLQAEVVRRVAKEVMDEKGITVEYMLGTMIELPRAALTADKIAEEAEFFSFGTNDLTQTVFGLSRDDSGRFLPIYVDNLKVLKADPFQTIDVDGVGQLVQIGVERGRKTRPNLKVGICGEHGGDPDSVNFFVKAGLNYVSCSPYRVPIARLAAAQAALGEAGRDK